MEFLGISDEAVEQIAASTAVRYTAATVTITLQEKTHPQALKALKKIALYDRAVFSITLDKLAEYLVKKQGAAGEPFKNERSKVKVTCIEWSAETSYYVDYMPRTSRVQVKEKEAEKADMLTIFIAVTLE